MADAIDWASLHRRIAESERSLAGVLDMDSDRMQALLDERRRQLAALADGPSPPVDVVSVLVVGVGPELYGLELAKLAGILSFGQCASIPGGPKELLGLVNARGEIWSAFDLRGLIGTTAADPSVGGHVVLLRHGRRRVSVRVDTANRVRTLARADLRHPSNGTTGRRREFINGVTSDSLIVVDLDALWTHPSIGEVP